MAKKCFAFLLFSIFFIFLSLHVHWSDSELWSLGLARDLFSDKNYSADYKSLFNLLLHSVYSFKMDNLQTIHAARIVFSVLGLLLVPQLYLILKNLIRDKDAALWGTLTLAGCTLYLSQGFKIRSDLLACFLQIAGILYFSFLKRRKSADSSLGSWEVVVGLLLNLGLLLTTPKAIYHFSVNFVFLFSLFLQTREKWLRKYLWAVFVFPVGIFLILLAWKHDQFGTALDFFLRSYSGSENHPAFWDLASLDFIVDALLKNPLLFALCLLGFARVKNQPKASLELPFAMATAASLFFILFHNDRLPFFIFSLLAFPMMYAGLLSAKLFQSFPLKKSRFLKISFAVFIAINAFYFTRSMLSEADNSQQIHALSQMENYLKQHHDPVYFDGTLVLPRNKNIYVFPAPLNTGNKQEVLNTLKRSDLSLVFFSNRLFYYLDDAYSTLENNFFIHIGSGVFARSRVFRSTHVISAKDWLATCAGLGNPSKIYMYVGENFLTMHWQKNQELSCQAPFKNSITGGSFVAFSAFEPISLATDLNFAQIFDHKPFY